MAGLIWAVLGGVVVGVIKYVKRSPKADAKAALATAIASDKVIVGGALMLAAILVGKALYFETYFALIDAAIIGGLGLGIKGGVHAARWLMAVYAFTSPVLVIAFGSGNAVMWPFVFYAACRSILAHQNVDRPAAIVNVAANRANADPSLHTATMASMPAATSSSPSVTFSRPPSVVSSSAALPAAASACTAQTTQSTTHEISEMESIEDRIYTQVGEELESGSTDKGIWTKAFAQAGGDDKNTRVLYIQARVAKLLMLEEEKEKARLAEQQAAAAEKVRLANMSLKQKLSEGAIGGEEAERETEGMGAGFLLAIRNGQFTVVERMVQDRLHLLAVRNSYGETCLHVATREKNCRMIEFLVDSGAYVSARNDNGETARDIARRENFSTVIALFDAIALRSNMT
jgi:hypothetical protein